MSFRRFLRDPPGGATAIAAAVVTVMAVGGTALIGDHVWLVDQRDVLKTASDAAAVAATLEMARLMDELPDIEDDALKAKLKKAAERYVKLSFQHLPEDRLKRAKDTLPSHNAFAQYFFGAVTGAAYECQAPPFPAGYSRQTCYHGQRYTLYNRGVSIQEAHEPQRGCPVDNPAILPLSTDRAEIVEAIGGLAPVGRATYSSLGVLWGQRLLQHGWKDVGGGAVHPVDPDAKESSGLRKAIVLLTDGEDTYCGFGTPTRPERNLGFSRADACTAAKAVGTEIFVIAAMHPDKVSTTLGKSLRECSSESEDSTVTYAYLNHSTPQELEATFTEIATQLREVRRVY